MRTHHHPPPKPRPGHIDGYCTEDRHKLSYVSRAKAKRALRVAQAGGGAVRSEYRCPICGNWHLTSQR